MGSFYRKEEERLEGELLKGNTCGNENSGKVGGGGKGRKKKMMFKD